jgi:hypothetical protein
VDGNTISPCSTIELLGVRYDRKLLTTPHVRLLLLAVRQRASMVARLANHLPRGTYLWQLSYGLVMGKFAHALADVASLRLESEDTASGIWSKIQVALNDVARSITGVRRPDHITIKDLLNLAGIESANRMVVKAIAAETWSCYHSNDKQEPCRVDLVLRQQDCHGKDNPVGQDRPDHGPPEGCDTFITHAANVWNRSSKL